MLKVLLYWLFSVFYFIEKLNVHKLWDRKIYRGRCMTFGFICFTLWVLNLLYWFQRWLKRFDLKDNIGIRTRDHSLKLCGRLLIGYLRTPYKLHGEFLAFIACNIIKRTQKMWNASRFCVSSLRRDRANLLCIVPILVYVLVKQVHQFILNSIM